jgi:hypothetical protein
MLYSAGWKSQSGAGYWIGSEACEELRIFEVLVEGDGGSGVEGSRGWVLCTVEWVLRGGWDST